MQELFESVTLEKIFDLKKNIHFKQNLNITYEIVTFYRTLYIILDLFL